MARAIAASAPLGRIPSTLGVIPAGTQNNIALSLGIPDDIPSAIAILRAGKRIKIDLGQITPGDPPDAAPIHFLELCSVGLTSSVFESADEIQHGHWDRIGDFLSTLVTSEPSEIRLTIDGKYRVASTGHVVIVANMPYTGRHFQIGEPRAFQDGLLDILCLGDLSKLKLLGYAVGKHEARQLDDPGVQYFQARCIDIETNPRDARHDRRNDARPRQCPHCD